MGGIERYRIVFSLSAFTFSVGSYPAYLSSSFFIALSACSNLWVGKQYVFLVVPSGYFLGLPGVGWYFGGVFIL